MVFDPSTDFDNNKNVIGPIKTGLVSKPKDFASSYSSKGLFELILKVWSFSSSGTR